MFYIKVNTKKKDIEGKALKVFDPERHDFLPEDGRAVPETAYWVQRLAKGDVVKCKPVDKAEEARLAAEKIAAQEKADLAEKKAKAKEKAQGVEQTGDESQAPAQKTKKKK